MVYLQNSPEMRFPLGEAERIHPVTLSWTVE